MEYGPYSVDSCMPLAPAELPHKLITAPTEAPKLIYAAPQIVPTMDANSFPQLGSAPTSAPQVVWGPGAVTADARAKFLPVASEQLRTGAAELFDAQHPRNQFAPKPRVSTASQVVPVAPNIDWSASGMTAMSGAVLQQHGNAAHLSPYAQAAPQVALSDLKQLGGKAAQTYVYQQPSKSVPLPNTTRLNAKVTQKRGR